MKSVHSDALHYIVDDLLYGPVVHAYHHAYIAIEASQRTKHNFTLVAVKSTEPIHYEIYLTTDIYALAGRPEAPPSKVQKSIRCSQWNALAETRIGQKRM